MILEKKKLPKITNIKYGGYIKYKNLIIAAENGVKILPPLFGEGESCRGNVPVVFEF